MRERINRTISILYRYGQRYLSARLRPLGLEVGQLPALMRICKTPGITQEQISLETGMDKGTTARSVQRLEEAGLVRRETDKADRRLNHIFPSPRAGAVEHEILAAVEGLHDILYEGMTELEITQAAVLMNRMKDNLAGRLCGGQISE